MPIAANVPRGWCIFLMFLQPIQANLGTRDAGLEFRSTFRGRPVVTHARDDVLFE
eukprot:COSAG02_NODE_25550_length_655_cov_1.145683_2_plen_55_part_01